MLVGGVVDLKVGDDANIAGMRRADELTEIVKKDAANEGRKEGMKEGLKEGLRSMQAALLTTLEVRFKG